MDVDSCDDKVSFDDDIDDKFDEVEDLSESFDVVMINEDLVKKSVIRKTHSFYGTVDLIDVGILENFASQKVLAHSSRLVSKWQKYIHHRVKS